MDEEVQKALWEICALAVGINQVMQRYVTTQEQYERLADANEAIEQIAGQPVIPSRFEH